MFIIIGLGNTKFRKIIDPSGTSVSYLRFTMHLVVKPNGNRRNPVLFLVYLSNNMVSIMKMQYISLDEIERKKKEQ